MFPLKPSEGLLLQENVLNFIALLSSNSSINAISNSTCNQANSVSWILFTFKECIYTTREEISFILGLITALCWIFAIFPQLHENRKKGHAEESLSLWFVTLWLLGDAINLIGCAMTNQVPFKIIIALCYVSLDLVLTLQFLYYLVKHWQWRNVCGGQINDVFISSPCSRNPLIFACLCVGMMFSVSLTTLGFTGSYVVTNRVERSLLETQSPLATFSWTSESTMGYVFGCVSSTLYIGSRLPQIRRNCMRGSTDGLSTSMILLAIAGNALYGTSILLDGPKPGQTIGDFLTLYFPWLLGSFSTLAFDVIILAQIMYLKAFNRDTKSISVNIFYEENDEEVTSTDYDLDSPLLV